MPLRHAAPVRKRLTVLANETTESCDYVFCEEVLRSVKISRCEACSFASASPRDTAGVAAVDCGCSITPLANDTVSNFPPAAAAVLPVGLALARPVVCVDGRLPLVALARTPILWRSSSVIPIVDHDGRLTSFLPKIGMALAALPGGLVNGPVFVADCAVSALSVHETASLHEAFAMMGRHRLREVTVVSDGGVVVGRLHDVDALHFVAQVARTRTRPALDCAA